MKKKTRKKKTADRSVEKRTNVQTIGRKKEKKNELIYHNDFSSHVNINNSATTTSDSSSSTMFSLPHLPKPKTPPSIYLTTLTTPAGSPIHHLHHLHHLQDASSYSVGIDIRSVINS